MSFDVYSLPPALPVPRTGTDAAVGEPHARPLDVSVAFTFGHAEPVGHPDRRDR